MALLLIAMGLLLAGGAGSFLASRSPMLATRLGVGGAIAGSILGLLAAARVLLSETPARLALPWAVPGGAFRVEIDALSAWFLLPLFVIAPLAAVYGGVYLRDEPGRGSRDAAWLLFDGLVASMALVLVARNAVLFLMAWEVMAITSFFLVTRDDEKESVCRAGWTYLVATHLGTAFLLAMFALLAKTTGSFDFEGFHAIGSDPATAGTVFLLALVGFGVKAGFIPFHVWLPEAHPAAPSHVSALMSGVMVKLGIYGILLVLGWLGPARPSWGWLLLGVGSASALLGALFALAQTDLKRILAYSTIENVGIVTSGVGLALLAEHAGRHDAALLAWGGSLLHVLNHAVFKGLLFLGAGSVLHATGTVEASRLGGLLRRMPRTGTFLLVGAAAAAAVPGLNGLPGEILILLAAFGALGSAFALVVVASMALVGGLAMMVFTRLAGIALLGEPRSAEAARAHDPGSGMVVPLALMAAACAALGLTFPWLYPAAVAAAPGVALDGPVAVPPAMVRLQVACGVVLVLTAIVALARHLMARRRPASVAPTWGCGFAAPSARMQYTASSFSEPITSLAAPILRTRRNLRAPEGFFPLAASSEPTSPDPFRVSLWAPAFEAAGRALSRLRWFQQGRVQIYVLYIALTMIALFVWSVGWPP